MFGSGNSVIFRQMMMIVPISGKRAKQATYYLVVEPKASTSISSHTLLHNLRVYCTVFCAAILLCFLNLIFRSASSSWNRSCKKTTKKQQKSFK